MADEQLPPGTAATGDDEISLLEILVVLARHKRLVFVFPFACAVIAALISLALPNIYTGTARILPPQQGLSPIASALIGDIAGSSTGGAVSQALGLKNPSDLYVGMLQSDTIADALIKRFGLQKLYDKDTIFDTRKKLNDVSDIGSDPRGIISVKVDDEDPKRAAAMANAYVDELIKLTQKVAVTAAGQQRIFLENQLHQVKDQLSGAEIALRNTQQKTGLISPEEQGGATVKSAVNLRAQVAAKQVQLAAMRASMTDNNPSYLLAQQELAQLRLELAKLEKSDSPDSDSIVPSAGKIPEAQLEFVRSWRDVKYYQTLFELIAKQYEIAKSQEAAEGVLVQVLDQAQVPDKKSKPHRSLIALITLVVAGMFGMVAAFLLEARDRARSDPAQARLLDELGRHLRGWRRQSGGEQPGSGGS